MPLDALCTVFAHAAHNWEQKLYNTESKSQTAAQTAEMPLQDSATSLAWGSLYKTDLLWFNWLCPRTWPINQRNKAIESCPLISGQWFCRLRGGHGGIKSQIPQAITVLNRTECGVYVWLCMDTGLVMNPHTKWTFEQSLRLWLGQPVSCKIRKTMGH